MRSSRQAKIFIMAALLVLLFLAPSSDAITCGNVIEDLKPCFSYLQSGSGIPPPPCCAGVEVLVASAKTPADRQTACVCLKTASKSYNVKAQLAENLPKNCGFNLHYPISPNADCSTIP